MTTVDIDWIVDPVAVISPGVGVVIEGDLGTTTTVAVPVTLAAPVNQPVTVEWTTFDTGAPGIATDGVDYLTDTGQVVFAAGETEATVEITIVGDDLDEPPAWLGEWGVLAFSSPSANAEVDLGFFGLGIFIVIDDD